MTTYTAITDAQVDADSPVTVNLMTLLRSNPVAICEHATGAPSMEGAWTLIAEELDISAGTTSVDFIDTLSQTWDAHWGVKIHIGPADFSADCDLEVQFSINSGGAWGTAGGEFVKVNNQTIEGTDAGYKYQEGVVTFQDWGIGDTNYPSTGEKAMARGWAYTDSAAAIQGNHQFEGQDTAAYAGAFDSIRVTPSTGTFACDFIRVFVMPKTSYTIAAPISGTIT